MLSMVSGHQLTEQLRLPNMFDVVYLSNQSGFKRFLVAFNCWKQHISYQPIPGANPRFNTWLESAQRDLFWIRLNAGWYRVERMGNAQCEPTGKDGTY